MSQLLISGKVEKLRDYQLLKRKFDTGYLRQVDKFFSIEHGDRWLLVNSFFNRNVLETRDADTIALLDLFSEPLTFIVFLKKLSDRFRLNLSNPGKAELKKVAIYLSTTRVLIKYRFVVTEAFDEYAQLQKMRRFLVEMPRFVSIAFIITSLDCNFRCPDCFIYRGNWKKKFITRMTPEVFEYLHGFVMRMIPKGVKMRFPYSFYGGEPLLNKPMVEYASSRIRELEKQEMYGKITPEMSIVTNGSLIDDDSIRIFKAYDIHVAVSLDGVGSSHDANRIFPGRGGTFKMVLAGIRRLEKAGVKYNISWTIGPRNIDAVAKDIRWVAKHLKTKSIVFNIMRSLSGNTFRKEEEETFFKKMHHIYDVLRENGIKEGELQKYRFAGKKKWQMLPNPFSCPCCGGGKIVMRPDGKIGICQSGLVQDEVQWQTPEEIIDFLQDPIYLPRLARTPVFIKRCYQGCAYFGFCGGGCAYRVEKAKGTMYDACEDICMVERFLIERAIIEDYWEEPHI